ncbi:glycolate oxidase subunit GlcE [Rhizobium alvei]|uniref:Glycolate oxidase subunit GlcE n=1 Tax=Rhizobium alvei TaxID=1132659 RepID=A0ABT8YFK0_9HYPH|nr:glycolate oxidase subunit GlcE [Rhizobium alvei]MDO6962426.1 glycolate oxidase subunit GlcE [Rhizobium alvei]
MIVPANENELVDCIRDAAANSRRLEVIGGGTRRDLGGIVQADETVSTRALSGIAAYNPAEMVMTARAGTPLAEIRSALAANRQHLAFEPGDWRALMGSEGEPTIGGIFAANLSGPRRMAAGAARDHLLGVRFVNGRGEVVNAGGRVMKNVTGLDLVKILAGSYGTLGIMSEVTFKVLPQPQTETTLVLSGLDDEAACRIMAAANASPSDVSGAAFLPESCSRLFVDGALPEGSAILLRLEGPDFSVAERAAKLAALIGALAPLTRLEPDLSSRLWQEIRDVHPFRADGRTRPVWRVSVAPTAGHQLLSGLRMQTGLNGYYDWQGGLLWLRMEAEPEADMLRAGIRHLGGGHATLVRASVANRQSVAVFEPEAPAVAALSARIRQTFDPAGILNPGRMG